MFNICYATKVSVLYFQEIGQLLFLTLKDIGLKCVSSVGILREDSINIVLDYHRIKYTNDFKNIFYIPYQLEQLDNNKWFFNQNTLDILKNATWVWDYSIENCNFLKNNNIKSYFLPMGYHPSLKKITDSYCKDIDVLFYGTMNKRRELILQNIKNKNLNVKVLHNVFGLERNMYIARSKIVLNIHYYENMTMEIARISYLINNNRFILSESSQHNPYKDIGILCAKYKYLPELCHKISKNEKLLQKISDRNYSNFSQKYKMKDFMKNFLDKINI